MKKMKNRILSVRNMIYFVFIFLIVSLFLPGCRKTYTPKPRSYFRIDFPRKEYSAYQSDCPYTFDIPVYARVSPYAGSNAEPCWINIEFPGYKGTLHITYKALNNDLANHTEDVRTLAYKHIIKADDIIEKPFYYPERKVYGMIYDIRGNTASSLSFYITDSTKNFLSGALYFNVTPNKDSLAPVINFFAGDIAHMIDTFNWN